MKSEPERPSGRSDAVKKAIIALAAAGVLAWLIWLIHLLVLALVTRGEIRRRRDARTPRGIACARGGNRA